MNFPIYLDNNATTRIAPEVLKEMMPYLTDKFGNASGNTHIFGREASEAIEKARRQIAALINCTPEEIIFTGSSTESINLALKGLIENSSVQNPHIITSCIEHKAVLNTLSYLQSYGVKVTYLNVDGEGFIDPLELKKQITGNTVLVSIMAANNEIGTLQPIKELSEICSEAEIPFHSDAAQFIGKLPLDLNSINIDLLSFGAHKFYGPKGIGALYINKYKGLKIAPQIHGGGQEHGFRSGTYDTASIVGFGKAAELSKEKMYEDAGIQTKWQRDIIDAFLGSGKGSLLNGPKTNRLPNNINITMGDMTNSMFITKFREFAVSFGSACSSETLQPSYVLSNIGRTNQQISSSIRIGTGRFNTDEEIKYFIKRITEY